MEILIIAVIIFFVLQYNAIIDGNKFIKDNEKYFKALKEDDYEFLVRAKYGEDVEPEILFRRRLRDALLIFIFLIFLFLTNISFINVVLALVIAYLVFKSQYNSLKKYYKARLTQIDMLLPYYLKSLEILIQHYTVPVALSKSIADAPDIFKPGLRELIAKIDAGNNTVDPYMEFAKQYPVRDSMRMMRLLYRLGLGSQENKQDQLMMFSRTISSLQNKAREQKYKARLDVMESKTMLMLGVTGGGVMVILLISMMMMMKF